MQALLEAKGATFIKECKLIEIISDKDKFIEQQHTQKSTPSLHQEQPAIVYDHDCNLERIVLKRLDIPDEEEEEEEMDIDEKSQSEAARGEKADEEGVEDSNQLEGDSTMQENGENGQVEKKKKRKKNELELECGVLITCGHRDVDTDVFQAIHNNGLVYNGRLIVDKNF